MAVSLTLRNSRNMIENAIVDALQFAYGRRLPAVADAAALRAAPSRGLDDKQAMRYVTAAGQAYQWRAFETSADDGAAFVQPADVAAGKPGRWCRSGLTGITSALQTGYAERVDLYNDDGGDLETFTERLFGRTPAFLLSYERTERERKSLQPVTLRWCQAHFTLFVVSVSPRTDQTARQGSPIAATAAALPGTAAMIGDAMTVLGEGTNLGIADVAYVDIGEDQPVVKDLARGRYVESLELTVFYTETQPDATVVQMPAYGFNVDYRNADLDPSGVMDTQNEAVSDGLRFATGDGLTKSFTGGQMVLGGSTVTVAGAAKTFAPNVATYRDVAANGALTYTAVQVGDPPPPLGYGLVRLGVTVTDSTGVRLDRLLSAALIPTGVVDEVNPPGLVSIAVSPTNISIPAGTPVQFTATGTFDDTTTRDITQLVTWSAPGASASPAGVITASSPGSYQVTAASGGVSSPASTLTAT